MIMEASMNIQLGKNYKKTIANDRNGANQWDRGNCKKNVSEKHIYSGNRIMIGCTTSAANSLHKPAQKITNHSEQVKGYTG